MRIKIPQHEQELVLGKIEVHQRKRNRMKSQIPCRIPGILPLVGHRDNVAVQHVEPLGIPDIAMSRARQGMSLMLVQPFVEIEIVVLLAPQHSGQRLAVHATFVLAQRTRGDPIVEFVRISETGGEYLVKCAEWIGRRFRTQPQPHDLAATRGYFQTIMRGRLRSRLGRIHSLPLA